MIDPTQDPNVQRAPRAGEGGAAKARPAAQAGGPSFQALLERLSAQASQLGRDADALERPAELADAVERAESTLGEALALQEELLEAYRRSLLAGEGGTEEAR